MNNEVYLALGSNKGNKEQYLREVIILLDKDPKILVTNFSSIYVTKPFGNKEQDNFLNCVIKLSTDYGIIDLFNLVKNAEIEIGRTKSVKWGSREIDIDILFYDKEIYEDEELIIPHKEMLNRDFVVVPLQEIAPNMVHPIEEIKMSDVKIKKLEKNIIDKYRINLLEKKEN